LYKLESQGTPEEKANYLEMSKTDVHANYFMHQQAQNQNGQIFAGYLIDKAI
jgi:acyl-CoA hydrolase